MTESLKKLKEIVKKSWLNGLFYLSCFWYVFFFKIQTLHIVVFCNVNDFCYLKIIEKSIKLLFLNWVLSNSISENLFYDLKY